MATYEQVFTTKSSSAGELENNQVIYVDDLVLVPITNNIIQLRGTIYAGTTSTPVNGATIIVYNPNNEAIATDESRTIDGQVGSYSITFDGEYGQIYGVTALLEGYDSLNQNISFSSSAVSVLNFTLPLSTTQNAIYGTVTDASNTPIADANVTVDYSTDTIAVQTSEEGAYIATGGLQAGVQGTITVSKFGYIGETRAFTFPTTNFLEENFSLEIDPLANFTTITGQVLEQGGSTVLGISGAFVGLYRVDTSVTPENEVLIDSVLTDEYGYYTFTDIPAGYTYLVRATKVEEQTAG